MATDPDPDHGQPFSAWFRAAHGDGEPLRVGLLVPDARLTRVGANIVEDLRASGFTRLELLVVVRPPGRGQVRRWGRGTAWQLYLAIDRWRTRKLRRADERVATGRLLDGVPRLDGIVTGANEVPPALIERVGAAGLDVLLALDEPPVVRRFERTARHGVWTLRWGRTRDERAAGPGVRELLEGRPVTTLGLERLESGRAAELGQVTVATDATSLSRTRAKAGFAASHLVIRALRRLHAEGWSDPAQGAPPPGAPDPPNATPGNLELLRWLVPLAARRMGRRVARAVRGRRTAEWRIAVRLGGDLLGAGGTPDTDGFRWVDAPAGHFYADPFAVVHEGRRVVYFEDYRHADGRGAIAAAEVGADGRLGAPRPVIEARNHLSYPYAFEHDGAVWMIPESAGDDVVRLFRADPFPWAWVPHADLFHGRALDTSVCHHEGRWWFFTSMREPMGGATLLLLFHARGLTDPWSPHPGNPVSADVRDARGAGPIFRHAGRLIRPSQDGSRGYGHAIRLKEIVTLTTTAYEERLVATVPPSWQPGLVGTHTYSRSGDLEALDGKVLRPAAGRRGQRGARDASG